MPGYGMSYGKNGGGMKKKNKTMKKKPMRKPVSRKR